MRFSEAIIVINGKLISPGESMTIRVALESLANDILNDPLAKDFHSERIRKQYLENIDSIRNALYPAND